MEFEYQLTQWVKEWEQGRHSLGEMEPEQPSPHEIESVLEAVFGRVAEPARLAIAKSSAIKRTHPQWEAIMGDGLQALPSLTSEEQTYTPTELGEMLEPNLSAIKVNRLLKEAGYQVTYQTAKGKKRWRSTEKRVILR